MRYLKAFAFIIFSVHFISKFDLADYFNLNNCYYYLLNDIKNTNNN
jgi:hypothetical protein